DDDTNTAPKKPTTSEDSNFTRYGWSIRQNLYIDDAEARLRQALPTAKVVYLGSDIDRQPATGLTA
ncbi:hypothetical protein ACLQ25_31605, partial [Micromonospora sp. DT44]|uniref:hypothetical protein n=1 Tax=Micromonospora sp. DT44 TaxID=3393439 RepID=UPI003CEEB3DF